MRVRADWRACALVLAWLPILEGCGKAVPTVRDEIQELRHQTCLGEAPTNTADVQADGKRMTAEWTCAVSIPWTEYLTTLDAIPRYQRRKTTAIDATYARATETDQYLLTVSVRADRPGEVQVLFLAFPY